MSSTLPAPVPPKYTGLLLCGGRSSRMKQDKAFLRMLDSSKPGKEAELPLFQHLLRLAFPPSSILDGGIIVSARDEAQLERMKLPPFGAPQEHAIIDALPDARDTIGDIGPATGILTVHAKYPERTLVILAVDFPQARREALEELIKSHEATQGSPVTLFLHPEDGNPEPLMSVWTPKALQRLKENAAKGKSGPCFTAKQLWKEIRPESGIAEGYGLVRPSNPAWVQDADTPEEWERVFGSPPDAAEVQGTFAV